MKRSRNEKQDGRKKMHKVDPMEILLSDIFDKVFYSREKKPDYCWDCDGEGIVDVEVYRPHNFNRDGGVIDVKPMECETCGGTGRLEVEDE